MKTLEGVREVIKDCEYFDGLLLGVLGSDMDLTSEEIGAIRKIRDVLSSLHAQLTLRERQIGAVQAKRKPSIRRMR